MKHKKNYGNKCRHNISKSISLANKEQRGYITPQEFNLLANQAQMTIFESYFYSKNTKRPSRNLIEQMRSMRRI
jgi:hypothetical protein